MSSWCPGRGMHRGVALVLASALLLQVGCAGGLTRLDQDELRNPEPARSYRVLEKNGTELTFVALHLEGDFLVGTARFTERETIGEGETRREVVTNRYEETRIPWADVASVEADRGGRAGGGMLFALGSIALGAALFLILTGGGDQTPGGGGGGKDGL